MSMNISGAVNNIGQWFRAEIQGSTTAKADRAKGSGDAVCIAKFLKYVENKTEKMQSSVLEMKREMRHYRSDVEYVRQHPQDERCSSYGAQKGHNARWDAANRCKTLFIDSMVLERRIAKFQNIASNLKSATPVVSTQKDFSTYQPLANETTITKLNPDIPVKHK